MTVLSPMGRVPRRRPVPPRIRRRRRAGPWLAFLFVLIVIAVIVWWRVLGSANDTNPKSTADCRPRPTAALSGIQAKNVELRVYNATERTGLAKNVSDALKGRGFKITTTTNDPLGASRDVTGTGELRYGRGGTQQALFVSFQIPGLKLVQDNRADATVDLALGPSYKALASTQQVNAARQAAIKQAQSGGGGDGC